MWLVTVHSGWKLTLMRNFYLLCLREGKNFPSISFALTAGLPGWEAAQATQEKSERLERSNFNCRTLSSHQNSKTRWLFQSCGNNYNQLLDYFQKQWLPLQTAPGFYRDLHPPMASHVNSQCKSLCSWPYCYLLQLAFSFTSDIICVTGCRGWW